MVHCSGCQASFHKECVFPAISEVPDWKCQQCQGSAVGDQGAVDDGPNPGKMEIEDDNEAENELKEGKARPKKRKVTSEVEEEREIKKLSQSVHATAAELHFERLSTYIVDFVLQYSNADVETIPYSSHHKKGKKGQLDWKSLYALVEGVVKG